MTRTLIRYRNLTPKQKAFICNGWMPTKDFFLKSSYDEEKEKHMVVYALISPTSKIYVGQSCKLRRRLREYLNCRCKSQRRLNFSIRKHGFDNFKVIVLEECLTDEELDTAETRWISLLDATGKNGLNYMTGGGSLKRHSKESIQKMREAKIGPLNTMWGNTHTPEARKKISDTHKGAIRGEEWKTWIGNLHRGKPKTPEHRAKISNAKCIYSYHLMSPSGVIYTTKNLSVFCKERGLSEWKLGEVARGKRTPNKDWYVRRELL